MAEDARDDLKAKANKANWAGVNATVSREFISRLRANSRTPSARPPPFGTSSGTPVTN